MANLLQVSSAFGRAMETVDRDRVVRAVYPALAGPQGRRDAVRPARATSSPPRAEGYAFPTNLDRDQPVDGMSPATPGRPRPPGARRGGLAAEVLGARLDGVQEQRTLSH